MDAYLEREMEVLSTPPQPKPRRLQLPAWLRLGVQLTDRVSPDAAAAVAKRLFFTPIKRRPKADELARLDRATHFDVDTKHGRVAAYSWGRGPAVVVVHGWGGDAAQMTSLCEAFAAAGFRAVALDLPGHGRSDGSQTSVVHFGDAVAAVAGVIGPLDGIVAHSLGAAAVTLQLARAGLDAQRAVYLAPTADFHAFWSRFRGASGLSAEAWRLMKAQSEAWLGLTFEECFPITNAPNMTTPLLVLHDDSDREISQHEGARLASAWPGALFEGTTGLGHNRLLNDAATLARAVAFVAS
jgi:pimeloyl-ACP methyl ester carboxylesterase